MWISIICVVFNLQESSFMLNHLIGVLDIRQERGGLEMFDISAELFKLQRKDSSII